MPYFFDLDATLLDHQHSTGSGLDALIASTPELSTLVRDAMHPKWIEVERTHYSRYERGEIAFIEQRRERLRECFPDVCRELGENELDTMYSRYLHGYERSWRLYPEARAVLERLRGEPTALITNGDSVLQRAKIQKLEIEECFSGIFVSGELGFAKPDPRIFRKACDELGVAPKDVHFVGDNLTNDVEGSVRAGMKGVWHNRDRVPRPETSFEFREVFSLDEIFLRK